MKFKVCLMCVICCTLQLVYGVDILILNSRDDLVCLEVRAGETMEEVQARAELAEVDLDYGDETLIPMSAMRDFYAELLPKEKSDIRYIVTTLSDHPTPKLLFYKNALDSAGDRINHVHPLVFLGFVFSDDDLKVKIRNIKSKSWVWKTFMGGLKTSLNEEYHRNNLLPEHYEKFTEIIGIEMRKLEQWTSKARWDEMLNTLIKFVAHETDADRYNM